MSYTNTGPVRGECGHRHRTRATASECLERDRRGCASQGGYSDRRTHATEPDQLRGPQHDLAWVDDIIEALRRG